MAKAVSIRSYERDDRADCLALFDSNSPDYFAPDERAEYAAFLDAPRCQYLVACVPEHGVIAAGGYYVTEDPKLGALAWGIVARAWHRRGVGGELLILRLARLRALEVEAVRVRTSQRSRGFFERVGFREVSSIPNGFAPGIDLVELRWVPRAA